MVSAETHHAHWFYAGENDATHWGDLSEDSAVCKTGKQQSPVNFSTTKTVKGKQLAYRYNVADYKVENNGHTFQVMPQGKAQAIVINGKAYTFKQFHLYTPGKRTFKDKYFPTETHFVHQAEDSTLAVIGSVFKPGKDNPALSALTAKKLKAGESVTLKNLNIQALLPKDSKSFRLKDSPTTSPCNESMTRVVSKTPVQVDAAQFKAIHDITDGENSRPVQPLSDHEVNEDK